MISMIDILAGIGIICLGYLMYAIVMIIFDLVDGTVRKKPKQTCFVYCPRCRNELVSSNSFIEDRDGIVKYKCDKCGIVSFWDFAHYPVPYLRTCAGDCRHFYMDKTSHNYWCRHRLSCDPDTMIEFEPRIGCKED